MRRTYTGIMFPESTLEQLRPLRESVINLQSDCRPYSDQWRALDQVVRAVDECATFFTKDPTFFYRKAKPGNGC